MTCVIFLIAPVMCDLDLASNVTFQVVDHQPDTTSSPTTHLHTTTIYTPKCRHRESCDRLSISQTSFPWSDVANEGPDDLAKPALLSPSTLSTWRTPKHGPRLLVRIKSLPSAFQMAFKELMQRRGVIDRTNGLGPHPRLFHQEESVGVPQVSTRSRLDR